MNKENYALKLSVAGSVFMTVLGIGFAILTRSEAILLDGLFNLITFVMSLLTLKVATLIQKGESANFQFGYYGFEPLLNAIKGFIILILCIFAVSSVEALLQGGRQLQVGSAVIYAIIATLVCFIVAFSLKHYSKQQHSPLVDIDAFNWMVNGVISGGVALTFVIAFFLQNTAWSHFVPYVDPVLVCLLVLAVIKLPFQTIWDSVKQLLFASPESQLEQECRKRIQSLLHHELFEQSQIRMALMGRVFHVLVHVLVPESHQANQIHRSDQIRKKLFSSIDDLHPGLVLDVVFTGDAQWLQ